MYSKSNFSSEFCFAVSAPSFVTSFWWDSRKQGNERKKGRGRWKTQGAGENDARTKERGEHGENVWRRVKEGSHRCLSQHLESGSLGVCLLSYLFACWFPLHSDWQAMVKCFPHTPPPSPWQLLIPLSWLFKCVCCVLVCSHLLVSKSLSVCVCVCVQAEAQPHSSLFADTHLGTHHQRDLAVLECLDKGIKWQQKG